MNQLTLLLMLLMAVYSQAQDKLERTKPNLTIRQSFESTDLKNEPAAFLLTLPSQNASSYAIDGGVALEWEKLQSSNKIVIEYHGNTLIAKEQKNGQFGYSGTWYLSKLTDKIIKTNSILTTTAKYVRDVIASKGSFIQTSELSFYTQNPTKTTRLMLNRTFRFRPDNISYMVISPSVGYEYQNTFDAKADTKDSLQGTIFRGMAKAKIAYTFSRRVSVNVNGESQLIDVPNIQLFASGALRYDIVNTTRTPDGWHPYLQAGVDYILNRNANADSVFSIGLSYINGENPAQGLARQEYWLGALRFTL